MESLLDAVKRDEHAYAMISSALICSRSFPFVLLAAY